MRAIICNELTGYQNLKLEQRQEPQPENDEVLVRVSMAALNFFDTLITKGKYQVKPELPFTPGGEISGIIEKCGSQVSGFQQGDRIMAYIGHGGLQEKITINSQHLFKIPDQLTDEVAASLSITYGTAMHGLVDRAKIKKDETVAILGAAGGAGLAAVEVVKASGATPIAVASNKEKIELAKKHGAVEGILSTEADLKQQLKDITNGQGVDVIYDCVGGDLAEPALRALKWNGRYLVVGFASGDIPAIPLNLILLKGIHVQGVFWGRFIKEQPEDFQTHINQLLKWSCEEKLTPHIDRIFPLSQTIKALDILAERKAVGKILINLLDQS